MTKPAPANSPTPGAAVTFTVEPMDHRQFTSLISDLVALRFPRSNEVKPDVSIDGQFHYVEMFNSPKGPIMAIHDAHRVHVIRLDGARTLVIDPEPEFVTMTREDEDRIRGVA